MAKASQGMDVGKMAADGFGQMMNSMDFFKRAWSGLATPFTPTVNVEEIDKRITDLRAVEQWLSLNQNLLRSTIQGLEIQRGTLDAINTVTSSFGNAMKPSDDSMAQSVARHAAAAAQKSVEPPAPAAGAAKPGGLFGSFDWSPFGMPSSMLPGFHTASPSRIGSGEETGGATADAAATAASGGAAGAASGAGAAPTSRTGADEGAGAGASGEGASGAGSAGAGGGAPAAADAGAGNDASTGGATGAGGASPPPGMNPLAWWQMLQENFRQIAQAAAGDGSQASPFGLAGALPTAGGKAGGSSGSGGEAGSRGSRTGGRTGKAAGGATAAGSTGSSSRSGAAAKKKKAGDGAGRAASGSAGASTAAGKRSRGKAGSAKDSG